MVDQRGPSRKIRKELWELGAFYSTGYPDADRKAFPLMSEAAKDGELHAQAWLAYFFDNTSYPGYVRRMPCSGRAKAAEGGATFARAIHVGDLLPRCAKPRYARLFAGEAFGSLGPRAATYAASIEALGRMVRDGLGAPPDPAGALALFRYGATHHSDGSWRSLPGLGLFPRRRHAAQRCFAPICGWPHRSGCLKYDKEGAEDAYHQAGAQFVGTARQQRL